MLVRHRQFEIVRATPADSADIRRLFENIRYDAAIDLQFRRGNDPYRSFQEEDDGAVVLLLKETATGRTVGMGAASFHRVYLGGEVRRSAYLNGLKLLPEYHRRLRVLPEAFCRLREETQGESDICYAAVLRHNTPVQRLFERPHRSLPRFEKQGLYTSFLFSPSRKSGLPLEKGGAAGLDAFYARWLPEYDLAPLNRYMPGLTDEDFIIWQEGGRILAACALLDDRRNKNYYLNGYHGAYRLLSKLPTRLLGYPAVPKVGQTVNNVSLSMLLFDPTVDTAGRAQFIRSASFFAKGHEVVMVGLAENDPTYQAFRGLRHVPYSSFLYTVDMGGEMKLGDRPVYLDVAYM